MAEAYVTWKIDEPPPEWVAASPREVEQFRARANALDIGGRKIDVFEGATGPALMLDGAVFVDVLDEPMPHAIGRLLDEARTRQEAAKRAKQVQR